MPCEGRTRWICAGGSYLGSAPGLDIDTQFQGLRGVFSGESLSFITVAGVGPLLVNAFGLITEVEVEGGLTVDTGHVVAFEESLQYSIGRAGGSWVSSFLTSEGLVMDFTGHGRRVPAESQSGRVRQEPRPDAAPPEHVMEYAIQSRPSYSLLEVDLAPGEQLVTEAGAMAWMSSNMNVQTSVRGGIMSGLSRAALGGESFFQNTYEPQNGPGTIALAAGKPGDIIPYDVDGGILLLEKGALSGLHYRRHHQPPTFRACVGCLTKGCSSCGSRASAPCSSAPTGTSRRSTSTARTSSTTGTPSPGSPACNTG